jgi:phage gpG-like protein
MDLDARRPTLFSDALPADEREHAKYVSNNLRTLDSEVENLHSAVALYQWASQAAMEQTDTSSRFMILRWSTIGARTGAIAIYAFYQARQALNKALGGCPSLTAKINRKMLGQAWKAFDNGFPDFAGVRHVAAHGSELYNTPEERAAHSITGGYVEGAISIAPGSGATVVFQDVMNNGVYTSTYRGKVVKYRPDIQTVEILKKVSQMVWNEFTPAFEELRDAHIAQLLRQRQAKGDQTDG